MNPRIEKALIADSFELQGDEAITYDVMSLIHAISALLGAVAVLLWIFYWDELLPVVMLGTFMGFLDLGLYELLRMGGIDPKRRVIHNFADKDDPDYDVLVAAAWFFREMELDSFPKRLADHVLLNMLFWPFGIREQWARIKILVASKM